MDTDDTISGCYSDIPIEVYHHPQCPGVSSSRIKIPIQHSYAHLEAQQTKSTKSLRFGSAFHTFVNEPELFSNTYHIVSGKKPDVPPGKTPVTVADVELIQLMHKKLASHPDAAPLLKGARHELTYFSRDQETGILKKCRVDAINGDRISDLKTCADASAHAFARDARKYLYRVSAAYYLQIVSEVVGYPLRDFYLIACEHQAPHEVAVYRVDDRSLSTAENEIKEALKVLKRINEQPKTAWKGYPTGIKEIQI